MLTQSTLTLVEVSLRKSVVPKEKETHTYSTIRKHTLTLHHCNQSIRGYHILLSKCATLYFNAGTEQTKFFS